jgi:hypothetical protein
LKLLNVPWPELPSSSAWARRSSSTFLCCSPRTPNHLPRRHDCQLVHNPAEIARRARLAAASPPGASLQCPRQPATVKRHSTRCPTTSVSMRPLLLGVALALTDTYVSLREARPAQPRGRGRRLQALHLLPLSMFSWFFLQAVKEAHWCEGPASLPRIVPVEVNGSFLPVHIVSRSLLIGSLLLPREQWRQ